MTLIVSNTMLMVLAIGLLGAYTLVYLNQKNWKGVSVLVIIYSLLITHTLYSSGGCRPTWLSFINKPMTVNSVLFQEPTAIYVWGIEEGNNKPTCLILPWNMQQAQKANELMIDGTPWEMDEDQEEVFYPKPVPPLPPKQVQ